MQRFCAGEEAAFDVLYGRHSQPIAAFLRRMVGDPHLTEDLLQLTFLSMVRSRGRYVPGTQLRSWLLTIAANAARDNMRRSRVRKVTSLDDLHVEPAGETVQADSAASRALEVALQAISPDQREAVILHKVNDLSFPEIAQTLGISLSAAKVRAHRGYEKLRALLTRKEIW